jgi:cob(I)alamin adenosyltransferase
MGHRLSRIYTRTGDDGTTGLGDGSRVDKDHFRIEACGSIDELNGTIGWLLTLPVPEEMRGALVEIQHRLFDLGGEISIPGHRILADSDVAALESLLDGLNADLEPLREFILPGGVQAAAACHIARAVCRRAERRVVTLARAEALNRVSIRYLNRLSDLLFVMARTLNRRAGREDVLWRHERG